MVAMGACEKLRVAAAVVSLWVLVAGDVQVGRDSALERQRVAGVRLVGEDVSGQQQVHEEIPEMGSRQWSPGDRGGIVVKDRRPERGLGIEGLRMRAGSD